MTTFTITYTEEGCTIWISGLTSELADKKIRKLLKQKIHFRLDSNKRITGNLK